MSKVSCCLGNLLLAQDMVSPSDHHLERIFFSSIWHDIDSVRSLIWSEVKNCIYWCNIAIWVFFVFPAALCGVSDFFHFSHGASRNARLGATSPTDTSCGTVLRPRARHEDPGSYSNSEQLTCFCVQSYPLRCDWVRVFLADDLSQRPCSQRHCRRPPWWSSACVLHNTLVSSMNARYLPEA